MSSPTWIVPPCIASYCVINCSAYMFSLSSAHILIIRYVVMLTIWLRVLFHQRIVTDGQICDIVVFLSDPSWRTFALFEGCAAAPPLPTIREPQNTQLAVAVSRLSQQWCVQEPSTSQLRSWRFWLHEVGRASLLHCYLYSSINARIPRKLYVICD